MNIRKIASLATAGTLAVGMSVLSVGITPAFAEDEVVTFTVAGGSLAIAQTPAGTALVYDTAVEMPVTTVTDGNASFDRSAAWTVSVSITDLSEPGGGTIGKDQITLGEKGTGVATAGTFTSGSGTRVDKAAVVGGSIGASAALVGATGDTIDSVFTYVPTAALATQLLPHSGSYSGTVTQTVV